MDFAISSDKGLNQIPVIVVPSFSSGASSVKQASWIIPKSLPSINPNSHAFSFALSK